MRRTMITAILAVAATSCGQPDDKAKTTAVSPAAQDQVAATGDPCTLLADPAAVFGQVVTSHAVTAPNRMRMCEWRATDGMPCGTLAVFGPGWNEVPDVPRHYEGMVTSLGAFGEVQEVAGLGEEAHVVDGGMLGAQLAFRTRERATLVGAVCSGGAPTKTALAEKVAHAITETL